MVSPIIIHKENRMELIDEIGKIIESVYEGKFSTIENDIVKVMELSMKIDSIHQKELLAVFSEIEKAMIRKDYLYITDILRLELLSYMN